MPKKILLIGTLDSKAREVAYLRQRAEERGWTALVLDVGTLEEPLCQPDISQEEVARAGGEGLSEMKSRPT
jgi:uncharacterized protein (UPF0261 family)